MEKGQFLQQVVLEQLDTYMQKVNLDADITPFTKIHSKWITELNIKCKTIKLLKER